MARLYISLQKKGGLQRPPFVIYVIVGLLHNEFLNVAAAGAVQMEEVNALGEGVHRNLIHFGTTVVVDLILIDGLAHHIDNLGVELLSFVSSNFHIDVRGGRIRINANLNIVELADAGVLGIVLK